MKYLLGIILSLITGSAFAGAIPFPKCVVDNQPVAYRSVHSTYGNSYVINRTPYVAGSDIVNNRRIISYNPTLLSTYPEEWVLQVMLHECAHLKLRHTTQQNPIVKERDADCHSADVLRKEYGYKDEQFEIITDTMKDFLSNRRIAEFRSCATR